MSGRNEIWTKKKNLDESSFAGERDVARKGIKILGQGQAWAWIELKAELCMFHQIRKHAFDSVRSLGRYLF